MMDRRTVLILALACLAAAGGWWLQNRWTQQMPDQPPAPAGVKTFAVGDAASGYALPDLQGRPTSLAHWHGKAVLLNFWASWCVPCLKEMPMLAKFQHDHAADGLQIVGVAMEQPQSAAAFLKRVTVGYPILIGIDADPVPTTVFGDTAGLLPYSVLIGRDGRILETKLGPLDEGLLDDWLHQAASVRPR
ncbi:MAG TPA: TlpA disulfide reductase family protein [Rhodanobacteraceae bacterium]|nr:TlpA disulfide reductase family protein [Rhodanobacteraceae bacterium]